MDEELDFKEIRVQKAKESIKNQRQVEGNCQSLLEIIFKINYIYKNSIDIISCIYYYIKELIFSTFI